MRAILKRVLNPILKRIQAGYLKKPRRYAYNDITVWVQPSVFPPFITLSTKILLDFIAPLELKGKSFLELGCGCGIISILAAKKGANVTSSDINQVALDALQENAESNAAQLTIKYSDLFEDLQQPFDWIIINPPYYPKTPASVTEQAWFCGENFDYFEKLFLQLPQFITAKNEVFMILSEDCNISKIKSIAIDNKIGFKVVLEKKSTGERNFIFRLAAV